MDLSDTIEGSLKELKKALERRLEELEELDQASLDSRGTVALDQSRIGRVSRMAALQGQAMAAETARRRKIEIQRIKAALVRITKGEYGTCVTCEEEISLKRLTFDPSTPFCIKCARSSES